MNSFRVFALLFVDSASFLLAAFGVRRREHTESILSGREGELDVYYLVTRVAFRFEVELVESSMEVTMMKN